MAIALSLLLCQPTFAISPGTNENNQMAFEGSLTDQNGNPINLASATLNFYITANSCYLYGESSTVAGDSQGNILHRFGTGTAIGGTPNTFSQNLFFGAVNGTTSLGAACSVTASDTRLAQVYYPALNITATIKLGTVPFAANATMLDGKASTDFVQVSADTNTVFNGGSAGQFLTKSASGLTWTTNTLTAAQVNSALGYTPASATTSITATQITSALGYTPANNGSLVNYALRSNNLGDLTSSATARSNLGLGTLAIKNSVDLSTVEVTGTLPASRLPSFSGDVSTAAASSVTTVQALRGVALSATGPVSGQILVYNGTAWTPTTVPSGVGTVTNVSSSNSDISISSPSTTPVLTINSGVSASQLVRLDSSARLPGVDGSQLTNLNATQLSTGTIPTGRLPSFTGDVQTAAGSNTTTVAKIRGTDVATTAPVSGQVMMFTAGKWTPVNPALGSVTSVTAGSGLLGGTITNAGTLAVNFGTVSGSAAAGNDSRIVGALQASNNLSDVSNTATARSNLGLGSLAIKSFVNLSSEVSGVLPIANGGSQWTSSGSAIYFANNTTVGSSTVYSNVGLNVVAPTGVSIPITAAFNNFASDGSGVKINVDNNSPTLYGLRVSSFGATNFSVMNNGNIGVGPISPSARLHLAAGTASLASLKLSSGSLLAAAQPGAIEYDGMNLYLTDDSGLRRILASGNSLNSLDGVSNINSSGNISLNAPSGVVVSSTLPSTSYTNGALTVKGGIGIAGTGNFSGAVNALGNMTTSGTFFAGNNISTSGAISAVGSINTNGNLIAAGVISPFMYGGTTSGATLAIDSSSHANKGNIAIAANGGNVGIGIVNPIYKFQIKSPALNVYGSAYTATSGSATIGTSEDSNNQLFNIGFDTVGNPRWFFTTSGTNYINNDVSIGSATPIPNSRLSVHGNLSVNGAAAVSKTLILTASASGVPLQFLGNSILSTPLANTVEYDGSHLFFTNSSGSRRRIAGGAASGTIDNVNKLSYSGGTLALEGNTTGSNAAITITNLGAGAIGLQINDNVVVSGSIKLAGDGADANVTCTASEEGKQRYNTSLKTMEFCDGAYWQGLAGITHCTSIAGGASYTLVGVAGTGSAFCMSKIAEAATTYTGAVANCQNRTTSRNGARPYLCAQTNFEMACRQYSDFGANAEVNLPGYKNTDYWIPAGYDGSNMFIIKYTTSTTNVCNVTNMVNTQAADSSSKNYRCCYN